MRSDIGVMMVLGLVLFMFLLRKNYGGDVAFEDFKNKVGRIEEKVEDEKDFQRK